MKHFLNHSDKKQHSHIKPLPYDPEIAEPAVRCSICTGEKVAGLLDKRDGHFTEVMLIRSPKDEQQFKEEYRADSLKVIY